MNCLQVRRFRGAIADASTPPFALKVGQVFTPDSEILSLFYRLDVSEHPFFLTDDYLLKEACDFLPKCLLVERAGDTKMLSFAEALEATAGLLSDWNRDLATNLECWASAKVGFALDTVGETL